MRVRERCGVGGNNDSALRWLKTVVVGDAEGCDGFVSGEDQEELPEARGGLEGVNATRRVSRQ